MQFRKQIVSCLDHCLSQVQTLEQTQEVRLPEGTAGAGRILGTWGQAVLRSKEWMTDSVRLTGGVQAWVLYEEDGQLHCLNSWLPFRMDWDLPEDCPEGWVRVYPVVRTADARPVSAGKVLIRVGIAARTEVFSPRETTVCTPEEVPQEAELLRTQWPVRLWKEAGEKPFDLEETLLFPDSQPLPNQLLSWQLEPTVTDQKVLGNKLVFRGAGNLHLVYISEEGRLRCWDAELPFSQYAELSQSHSADARAAVTMAVTRLELEQDELGKLHLRAGLTGQYLVDDRQILETAEDAYSPYRNLSVTREEQQLPVLLDSSRETVKQELTVPVASLEVGDAVCFPDFPRQQREDDRIVLRQPGMLQVLYYDEEGKLCSTSQKMEGETSLRLDENASAHVQPGRAQMQVNTGIDTLTVRTEVPMHMSSWTRQTIPMVTALEVGEKREPDKNRPTLILRRAGTDRLWDLARENGSTVSAIQIANGFTGEPEERRMLLIPVV